MRQTCNACSVSLDDRPCIFVDSEPHCFKCAKETVDELEQAPIREYERQMKIYEGEKSAFKKRNPQFDTEEPWLDWGIVLFGVIGWLVLPVIGTIIGVMGWQATRRFLWNRKQNRLHTVFASKNPSPQPPSPVKFDLELDESRFGEPASDDYRLSILTRDDFTCQDCQQQFLSKDLEVHHIKIQAKGGAHHRTNLVTLCISCHDREKWFGHKRMFPTTL